MIRIKCLLGPVTAYVGVALFALATPAEAVPTILVEIANVDRVNMTDSVRGAGPDQLRLIMTPSPAGSAKILLAVEWESTPGTPTTVPVPFGVLNVTASNATMDEAKTAQVRAALEHCSKMAMMAAARPTQFTFRILFGLWAGSAQLLTSGTSTPNDDWLYVHLAPGSSTTLGTEFRCELARKATSTAGAVTAPLEVDPSLLLLGPLEAEVREAADGHEPERP